MEFDITFDGGLKVTANYAGTKAIRTDQSVEAGGDGSAPEPFTLFLASIGTCAGIYLLQFCRHHGLPTDGIHLVEKTVADETTHRIARIEIEVRVPPGFTEKHLKALERSADLCLVKRTILNPPEFAVRAVTED